jgi:hypothetical protein
MVLLGLSKKYMNLKNFMGVKVPLDLKDYKGIKK